MYIVQIIKNLFFSGEPAGTTNKNLAVKFADKKAAETYAKSCGGIVVESKRGK